MPGKNSIIRAAESVRDALSKTDRGRLDKLLGLLDDQGQIVLKDALDSLYPGENRETALTNFRNFRKAVREAADESGIRFSIESDDQKRADPADRVVSFDAESRTEAEVIRILEADVRDLVREPQF